MLGIVLRIIGGGTLGFVWGDLLFTTDSNVLSDTTLGILVIVGWAAILLAPIGDDF